MLIRPEEEYYPVAISQQKHATFNLQVPGCLVRFAAMKHVASVAVVVVVVSS